MTSNIGSQHLLEGVSASGEISERARNAVMGEMRQHFRPEFLNRVDDIVLFKRLTFDEIEQIVELLIGELRRRLADRNIRSNSPRRPASLWPARVRPGLRCAPAAALLAA